MFTKQIDKGIDQGAKMARLMYNAGQQGLTKEQALELALEGVPAGQFSGKLKAALKHYFTQ